MWHDDIQTIGRAALEDRHQHFLPLPRLLSAQRRALEPERSRTDSARANAELRRKILRECAMVLPAWFYLRGFTCVVLPAWFYLRGFTCVGHLR